MSDLREVLKNLQLAARCIQASTDDHAIMFYIRGWPFSARDVRALANSPDFRQATDTLDAKDAPRAPDGRDAVAEALHGRRAIVRCAVLDENKHPQDRAAAHRVGKQIDTALASLDSEKAGE